MSLWQELNGFVVAKVPSVMIVDVVITPDNYSNFPATELRVFLKKLKNESYIYIRNDYQKPIRQISI